MADAKKCDRCGGYYEEANRSFKINGHRASRIRILGVGGGLIGDYDLCDHCAREYFKFLCSEPEQSKPDNPVGWDEQKQEFVYEEG